MIFNNYMCQEWKMKGRETVAANGQRGERHSKIKECWGRKEQNCQTDKRQEWKLPKSVRQSSVPKLRVLSTSIRRRVKCEMGAGKPGSHFTKVKRENIRNNCATRKEWDSRLILSSVLSSVLSAITKSSSSPSLFIPVLLLLILNSVLSPCLNRANHLRGSGRRRVMQDDDDIFPLLLDFHSSLFPLTSSFIPSSSPRSIIISGRMKEAKNEKQITVDFCCSV